MIVFEWERHKEVLLLRGLAHAHGPGPPTPICRKKNLPIVGVQRHGEAEVSQPELPSQLRASVLCFKKKENFWKSGFVKVFFNLLLIYSRCILRDIAKTTTVATNP